MDRLNLTATTNMGNHLLPSLLDDLRVHAALASGDRLGGHARLGENAQSLPFVGGLWDRMGSESDCLLEETSTSALSKHVVKADADPDPQLTDDMGISKGRREVKLVSRDGAMVYID